MTPAVGLCAAALALLGACGQRETPPAPSARDESAAAVPESAPQPADEVLPDLARSALPTASAGASPTSSATRRYSVAAIGDSLTDPASHGGGYLRWLATRCPESRFDSWGKGGNMVSQMQARFARDVLGEGAPRPAYTHVLVLGGIADVGSSETAHRTVEKIQRDLGSMYAAARARGLVVVAFTIPPWGRYRGYDDARHEMMLTMNAWLRARPPDVDHVIDVFSELVCDGRALCTKYAADRIHWNAAAHELVGERLYREVFVDCR